MSRLKRTQKPVSDLPCAPPMQSINAMAHPSRCFVPIVVRILANWDTGTNFQRKNLQLLDAFPHRSMLFTLKWAIFQMQKNGHCYNENPQ